ncbi:unnamed protein product [Schistosoma mattheei]|uniref:MULE transposase domain-containing protein n=1 Tax=Schistosoma mattheei TaxID=31246 RepID=A0AA85ATH3_9TREM|nr:unnamed protein product [Schistosoma mattheei]
MNLKAIPVCIAFISRETSTLISRFLSFFQGLTNSRQVVGIVTDDSPAIAAAIMQVYPNAHHILCRVHLVRNVIKRRVRSEVIQLFFRLMFTQTVESFNNVLSLIEISDGTFARYVRDHLHKWSTAFRPSATLLQLNNTNFVETSHRILKMHQLSRKTPVLRSIFSVLLRVGYWMEARLQKYTSDCRVKANIGQEPAMRGLQERLTPAACQVLRRHLRTPLTEFVMSADLFTAVDATGTLQRR